MKTMNEIVNEIKRKIENRDCALDGRDINRLVNLLDYEHAKEHLVDQTTKDEWDYTELSEKVVIDKLLKNAVFGLEKANNERGISSHAQYKCVQVLLWVLSDNTTFHTTHEYFKDYFETVIAKYGLKKGQV